ncbi:hypothetical protein RZS08_32420, partial [Arthrospira platensis SPKY1]|nr:hypothetical protein [Arthrospira platensis SPKY1]
MAQARLDQAGQFLDQFRLVHHGHPLQGVGVRRELFLTQGRQHDQLALAKQGVMAQTRDQGGAVDARQKNVDNEQVGLQMAE